MKLTKDFFIKQEPLVIAKALLGKTLVTKIDGKLTSGIIIETEAYLAPEDKASHAFNNKKTPRNQAMFLEGGIAYVYLCYGLHSMFNIVTGTHNVPHGILIRSIRPQIGIDTMLVRRNLTSLCKNFTIGPGKTTQALGIKCAHNAIDLTANEIWLEDNQSPRQIASNSIITTPRIGINYAQEYKDKPWRFLLNEF